MNIPKGGKLSDSEIISSRQVVSACGILDKVADVGNGFNVSEELAVGSGHVVAHLLKLRQNGQ